MVPPDPKRQREAWTVLSRLWEFPANVRIIHYSCESFYDRADGRSPRVTSIAIRKLNDGQTHSFSIHQVAERQGIKLSAIEDERVRLAEQDRLEKTMLEELYQHVSSLGEVQYLHWNMRDSNYGFAALEQRLRVLKGVPVVIDDRFKVDLSRLLIDIYGNSYMRNPRLVHLLDYNGISRLQFLTGEEEANAFVAREYVRLHQSTLRKVDVLADIADRANRRILRTYASIWTVHGGSVRALASWIVQNPLILFVLAVSGGIGGIYSLVKWVIAPLIAALKHSHV